MDNEPSSDGVPDTLTLRFVGEERDGTELHELRAAHVADVLQGLVGIASDFTKAGVFGERPSGSEVLVRPAQEGSFLIEVLTFIAAHKDDLATGGVLGVPTLGSVIWWATKSARADVSDVDHLANGNVKVSWQDNTVDEVPLAAWQELNKRSRRRKKHLRQIMAPLSDQRVSALEMQSPPADETEKSARAQIFTLTRPDYDAVRLDDEVNERQSLFQIEAQMSAINFDDPTKWRVRTKDVNRAATVEDQEFLGRIANGLAIRKSDIFRLTVREDKVEKNGRTRRTWTVLKVESFRRASHDGDT